MKDLNYIAHEIMKERNLEYNLGKYTVGMKSLYVSLAEMKLSMNYFTLYDMMQEQTSMGTQPYFQELLSSFQTILTKQVLSDSADTAEIRNLRKTLTETMEMITAFVDRFRIYEYVLNRVEYRFREEKADEKYYGMYFTNDLMHYIFSDKDNVAVNQRICEVAGQLPIRISRSRFYEYIREAFSLYHGAQRGTIDDFAYTLRTSAALSMQEEAADRFPEIYREYQTLTGADYTEMSKEQYQQFHDALQRGTDAVTNLADDFVLLTQMVNDAYTIQLGKQHALTDNEENHIAEAIITYVCDCFSGAKVFDANEADRFSAFEGKQEKILSLLSQVDYAVTQTDLTGEVFSAYPEQKQDMQELSVMQKLQSGSDFILLEQQPEKLEIPEDTYADEVCEKLIGEMNVSFENCSTPVRRAVMASVVAQLPVLFHNTDEIQEYINLSLEQCTDEAEKLAVLEIMRQIMAEPA